MRLWRRRDGRSGGGPIRTPVVCVVCYECMCISMCVRVLYESNKTVERERVRYRVCVDE